MVSTLMTAVTGVVLAAASPAGWQNDYRSALAQSAVSQKPIAVLIGRGDAAGRVPAAAAAAFQANFVCLSVNVETADGQATATAFGLADGLVISDAGGKVQALRVAGPVPAADLAKYAATFATPQPVAVTQTVGDAAVVQAQMTVPAMTAPAVYAPAPVLYSAPVYRSGGCPNGRCGR